LDENGTAYEILKSSTQYAVELGERLRDKVYEEIIPDLSLAIADALIERDYEMDAEGLDLAYQLTLRVFFRMLFQVYAEDRKLLPYGENTKYDRNAIKTMAKDFVENPDQEFDEDSTSLWDDLAQVWRVIDSGDRAWGVPAYNGGLFASDKEINEHGYILKDVHISNSVMGPVLKALLLDEADDGETGQIDFRSLSVREFGTIYEGLLESSLGLAEVDLTLDDKGTWIPAKKKDEVYAYAGQVYFHNTSGQRKGTGSYFTPSFVVEHLLERSLDPALDAHLEKVKALIAKQDHAGAGELFFDFRVADLAMGSGHFLTSAIDHIEQRMAAFLAEDGNVIPGVTAELLKLENAAIDALGPDAPEPERSSLLRRQIARRCIYGLDINPIAVELARVSIWIHTFVRGLPMSSLDHNLVCANSLTGIGSVEEALDVLVPGRKGNPSFFDAPIEEALESAKTVLVDASLLAESTKEESRAASRASRKALKEAETAKLLFDAAVLTRIGRADLVGGTTPTAIAQLASSEAAQDELIPLNPAHMPVLFPEVFLRANAGFDVLVGNPPWDKIEADSRLFAKRHLPGLGDASTQKEKDEAIAKIFKQRPDLRDDFETEQKRQLLLREVLLAGPYPGLGIDHPDLAKAFAWRNFSLLSDSGVSALVLPRLVLAGRAMEEWRRAILGHGVSSEITMLGNLGGYVFANVHAQKEFALVVVNNGQKKGHVFCGPLRSGKDWENDRHSFAAINESLLGENFEVPNLPDSVAVGILKQMMLHTKFKDSQFFRKTVYETDQTKNKENFILDTDSSAPNLVPVYKDASLNLWTPDTGEFYALADQRKIEGFLLEKTVALSQKKSSAFAGEKITKQNLPFANYRIAYRWTTNATNTRTFIVSIVPQNVVLTNKTPYLMSLKVDPLLDAYLVGVFSSRVFDWMVRLYVEGTMRQGILNSLPIPDVNESDQRFVSLAKLTARMFSNSSKLKNWVKLVDSSLGSVSDIEKENTEAHMDAIVANLYGLNRAQVEHIHKTFHRGWDYAPRLEKVLSFYDKLPKVAS
jgi:hypothetical protein